jgi:two-component system, OmpR family, sensor kinase
LLPMLGLIFFVAGVIVLVLRRGLKSLDRTAHDLAARSVSSLKPIPDVEIPKEISPLVTAINGLMDRLAEGLNTQRRFLADAAHELRSPVTALRLQLQLLKRSEDRISQAQAVAAIEAGIERSQQLIEKLLQLARSEPGGVFVQDEMVNLGALVRTVVTSLSIQAEHRNIDLGAFGDADIFVQATNEQVTLLLSNLVENALKYIPEGSVIDVKAVVIDGKPTLQVIDDGPGIPVEERNRVFDRFYRGVGVRSGSIAPVGSGLGLAIVRSIADRLGAKVSLHDPSSGKGLEVRVVFAVPSV